MDQKPSVGRIVHFVDPQNFHIAAIITRVEGGTVDLYLFYPPDHEIYHHSILSHILPDEDHFAAFTWHWPERV